MDTVRKGFFSDDHLVRIYYGTVRLGISMGWVEPGWVSNRGDTVVMTLPPIGLLDVDFIDEARTKSFYETGSWSHADREALYRKARQQMRNRALTPENEEKARENGRAQFQRMLKAMGYDKAIVRFSGEVE